MQANSTINQNATSDLQHAYIKNDATSWADSARPLDEQRLLTVEGDAATWKDQFPNLLATLNFRLLRWSPPYALQSEKQKVRYLWCKQGVDVIGALLLLTLASPLFLIVALCIKITSPGPVFYKHRRLGHGGKEFWCFKFRTMAVDAEEQLKKNAELFKQFEVSYKIKNDPRVTRLGALLRKTSLDELPQLINVLTEDMSLVGPRPIVTPELSKYSIYGDKLLSVKPGLSGLWQVCGRSDVSYPERVLLDMHYIDHRSLWLDLQLLFRTPMAVFKGHGAC